MASVEQSIYSIIQLNSNVTNLVSTRVYPDYAPQASALPYLVYQEISADRDHTHGGASGYVEARYQVSVFDDDYTGCRTLANYVRIALDGSSASATTNNVLVDRILIENEVDIPVFPPELQAARMYGKALDFRVFYHE